MSYIRGNLLNGEQIVHESKLHWIIFSTPAFSGILTIFFLASGNDVFTAMGAFLLILTIVISISALISFKTSEFAVTNKRVMIKTGLIKRRLVETLLNKIEGIQVEQGLMGRMLNYGSIATIGTGGTRDVFHKIENPLEFRKKVQEQIAQ